MTNPDFPIREYGLIGDLRTAALIAIDGSIDWCCWPNFDSPAVFCRLLDRNRGGSFRVRPRTRFSSSHAYIPSTNVLTTVFEASSGKVRLTDFMPIKRLVGKKRSNAPGPHRVILRKVEGLSGQSDLEVTFNPTFSYAGVETQLTIESNGAVAIGDNRTLVVRTPVKFQTHKSHGLTASFSIQAGETVWFELSYYDNQNPKEVELSDYDSLLKQTIKFWREWVDQSSYEGPYAELVQRSALVLKLLTFAPTGALIAAPTTSLPESVGGMRNWDYRYTWLRDSSLIIYALQLIGYHREATDFLEWLNRLEMAKTEKLFPLYSIHGSTDLEEGELDWLRGYCDSRPVRIGNAALNQLQLDIYGEVLDATFLYHQRLKKPLPKKWWDEVCYLANQASRRWREPDNGIWESRGGLQHFLHSKLMCWVALDRALKIDIECDAGTFSRWKQSRDEIARVILDEGYNPTIQSFTQTLGGDDLDATALMIPTLGFLPVTDYRMQSTLARIQDQLTSGGLLYRYRTEDGLPGNEATFGICSFWMVDNLALSGRISEARELFEILAGYGSDLGLFSEEIETSTRNLLGNFPQGFTHLALIRSAFHITEAEALGPEREVHDPSDRTRKMEQSGYLVEAIDEADQS